MARTVSVSDESILAAFDDIDDPIRTVPGMANDLDLGEDAIRIRLKDLEKRGLVNSKRVGSRSVVWWRSD